MGLKRILAHQNKTTLDETWDYAHEPVISDAHLVCDWSVVDDGSKARPDCFHARACSGHREDDLLPFANFRDRNETYTNREFWNFISPTNDDLPYAFDSFTRWPGCAAQNLNFESLVADWGPTPAPTATTTFAPTMPTAPMPTIGTTTPPTINTAAYAVLGSLVVAGISRSDAEAYADVFVEAIANVTDVSADDVAVVGVAAAAPDGGRRRLGRVVGVAVDFSIAVTGRATATAVAADLVALTTGRVDAALTVAARRAGAGETFAAVRAEALGAAEALSAAGASSASRATSSSFLTYAVAAAAVVAVAAGVAVGRWRPPAAGALRADDMVPVPFAKEALDEGDAAPLLAR